MKQPEYNMQKDAENSSTKAQFGSLGQKREEGKTLVMREEKRIEGIVTLFGSFENQWNNFEYKVIKYLFKTFLRIKQVF